MRVFAGTFRAGRTYLSKEEDAMKAHFPKLPTNLWAVAAVAMILIAYPIARIVIPAVVHAVLPDAVRTVLRLI